MLYSGTESLLPSLSYLSFLRDKTAPQPLCITAPSDWYTRDVQKFILEQRLVILVQQHVEDTREGKDTSHSCHALTMAHGDFVYWRGLWEVVDHISSNEGYKDPMVALAQLVGSLSGDGGRSTLTVSSFFQFSLSILIAAHPLLCPPLTLTSAQRASLRSAYDASIQQVAKQHVQTIINAYGFTEFELDSALARSNQTPYEALLEGAMKSEMNHMQHLWPMMVDTRRIWQQMQQGKEKEQVKARL